MIMLGLNAYHGDSSACVIRDGELIAAVEEERFCRQKHWAGLPVRSLEYCLEATGITLADVDAMIGRTREDALYELTEAYDNGEIQKSLVISARLLESGLHPLVIVAGLRNHLRRLLLVCSFRMQSEPVFVDGMSFAAFQKGYLAQLKIAKADLLQTFPRHPYALYMMFTKARKSSARDLLSALKKLLEVEFCLKSSPLTGQVVLEGFFFTTL